MLSTAIEKLRGKETVLVLEDVDSLFDRDRQGKYVTFSGMLNALDGICGATNGALVFLTTNHPERIDPAMMRPGRVDVVMEFSLANLDQAAEMFRTFYPDAGGRVVSDFRRRLADRFDIKDVAPREAGEDGALPRCAAETGDGDATADAATKCTTETNETTAVAGKRRRDQQGGGRVDCAKRRKGRQPTASPRLPFALAALQEYFIAQRAVPAEEAVESLDAFALPNSDSVRSGASIPSYVM